MSKHQMIVPLVQLYEGEPLASTEAIAHDVKLGHASVLKLTRKHLESLELFGRVRFEIRPFQTRGGVQHREVALLNEQQSTLLVAMMKNSPIVVRCKVRLVQEFFRMRDALNQRAQGLWQQMQALIAQEVESKVKATYGSRLMLDRKREIPFFQTEHQRLGAEIQPPLFH